jgi:hypothetical protein
VYDVPVPLGLFGGTHELLPCGLLRGDLVELFRNNKSKYYWYDLTVRGERYRGSTKETNETRAQKAAALKLAAAIKGSDPLDRKPPTLREYSKDFLQWVETGRLEADSRRYYRNGWRLLEQTKIAGMRKDQITKDKVEKLQFPRSASNGKRASDVAEDVFQSQGAQGSHVRSIAYMQRSIHRVHLPLLPVPSGRWPTRLYRRVTARWRVILPESVRWRSI